MRVADLRLLRAIPAGLALATLLLTGCASRQGPLPSKAKELLPSHAGSYERPSLEEPSPLELQFASMLPASTRERVRIDPALRPVAEILAEDYPRRKKEMPRLVAQWLVWRAGVAAPLSYTRTSWAEGATQDRVLEQSLAQWAADLTTDSPLRCALSRVLGQVTPSRQALVCVDGTAELSPVPARVEPGAEVTMRLRMPPDSARVKAYHLCGEPTVPVPSATGELTVSCAAPAEPGRYFVEVTITPPGTRWWRSVMFVPIYVGVDPEPTPPPELYEQVELAGEPEELAAQLLALVNGERERLGHAPLQLDPQLTTAAALVVERAAQDPAAETDPELLSRLRQAAPEVYAFDAYRDLGAQPRDFAWKLVHRPSARAALLHPATRWVGFGILLKERGRIDVVVHSARARSPAVP